MVVGMAALIALVGCNLPYETTDSSETESAVQTYRVQQPSPEVELAARAPSLMSVPAGTIIEVRLRKSLDSGRSRVGDTFSARLVEDVVVNGRPAIRVGSIVRGVVQDLRAAERGAGNAKLVLAFTRLEMRGNYATPMIASLPERSESRKKRNAAVIGGSAAGGAQLGGLVGKETKGAVVGSIVGGATGTGVVMAGEGKQVSLPKGTELAIKLDEGIKVPR
jgi:hypothetical protein